ncbi:MAG: hypothetical protein JSV88_08795 [Candidatus Aminicenantes bacterium]|nr:MAG: hypothetical protein JSV88_08795 [Candidatus Aminicenantes bacterium]
MKREKSLVLLLTILVILMLTACATFNKSHTSHFAQQQRMVEQGRIEEVAQKLDAKARNEGRDGVLHALAAGYYYLFMQDYEKSKELFHMAENQIASYEERAIISARDIANGAKAALTSDMELPYKGQMFEKIMVNTLLAMNYLFKRDIEGANVEIRRAELRQKQAMDKHQKELEKIEKQKEENKIEDKSLNSICSHYNVLDEYAAKVINSFQNGFTYFLGGLVYELNQSPNDAYLDYKKSFKLYNNKYILEKLIELSQQLNRQDENENWVSMYKDFFNGEAQIHNPGKNPNPENAELVVVYFCGNVPRKTQAKFSLWLPKKSFNVAFPFYDKNTFYTDNGLLEINRNGETLGKSELVLDFNPIVVKALKEKLPGIVVRQIIRLIAKNELEKKAEKKGGVLGEIGAKIFKTVTERADLRGWYELPCNIQVFRSKIEPGQSKITLKEISESGEFFIEDIDLDIPEKRTALVFVQQLSSETSTHTIVL